MTPLAFKVSAAHGGWLLSHNGQGMATFETRAEAERAALAVAVRHPSNRTAQVNLENGDDPTRTVVIF